MQKEFALAEIENALPSGVRISRFTVGDSETAPTVIYSVWPPNTLMDPHTHASDYSEIILAGKQRVGRKWFSVGDVRVAKAGTFYGPVQAGPEGCTVMVVFAGPHWQAIRRDPKPATPVSVDAV